jgi:hypothetical protein
MKKVFYSLMMVFVLVLAACDSPAADDGSQPSADQVATVVNMTLQALSSEVAVAATNTPAAEAPASTLPHSLYFLGKDKEWISQVYRLERDGSTKTQLTFESTDVTDYDVSAADGSVGYVLENQLLLVNADGSNRRLVLDGGPRENNPWVTRPVFSRDGRLLAYGRDGLNLYDVQTQASSLVLPNQYADPLPDGARLPIETYEPVSYSPDGTKLLLALGHWEQAPAHGVYDLATNTLVHYTPVEDYIYCCSFHGGPVWAPDSSSFYGVASVHDTIYQAGELWKVEAGNGTLTRMLKPEEGMMNLSKEIFLAPDGHLYYFFGSFGTDSGYFEPPVLELVRSGPDGVTDRTVLREENFRLMTEALWAPDASLVVVATVPERRWDQGVGVLELYPTNGQQESVWIAPYGEQMKWGP